MTQDEIIEMARQAGMEVHGSKGQIRLGLDVFTGNDTTDQVVALAKLVDAKTEARVRDACAKLIEAEIGMNPTWQKHLAAKLRGEA